MLSEKVLALQKNLEMLTEVNTIIEKAKPIVKGMEEVYNELNAFITSGKINAMDIEMKTAIESACRIFESAYKGLKDKSVSALFC